MIDFAKFKKSLGPIVASLTDEQIERLRTMQDQIADLFFDVWLKKRNDFKGIQQDLIKVKDRGTVLV